MTRLEWLQKRQQGIGGSDAGAILGLNKWKTPFQIYLDKTEAIIGEDEQSEAAYWGTELEDLVAREFSKRTGKKIRRKNQLLQHPEHQFMVANLDRDIVGENTFLECKTVNAFGAKEWEDDEIPPSYLIQVMHYMAVTGNEKCFIACLIGGQRFIWKEVLRDEELIEMIIQAEKDFWANHIEKKVPPALDGSSAAERYLNEKYKIADPGASIDLSSEHAGKIYRLLELKETIKKLEEQEKEIENNIKNELGTAEIGCSPKYEVSWKQVVSHRVDSKLLKKEYEDIYKRVCKESVSRRFTIKELKEGI
ncbi:MAG: YqaJ viral recombinase family protein [Bacteroidales bacterium]